MGKKSLHIHFKTTAKILCLVAAAAMIIALGLLFKYHISNEWEQRVLLPAAFVPGSGDSVTVFAPHSDDETLGCGGLLAEAKRKGAKIHVVLVTNGDGFMFAAMRALETVRLTPSRLIGFAYSRQKETLGALGTLGIPKSDVTFLGYPDRGVARMWDTYWDKSTLYTSPATASNHTPYSNSFTRKAPYCGDSLLDDIERVLRRDQPTDVYVPHPADNHPDHYATYCFVAAAIANLAEQGCDFARKIRMHTYLVHRGDWPTPKGDHAEESIAPPYGLAHSETKWSTLRLPLEIAKMKRDAIRKYKTQTAVERSFMMSFARTNEVFGTLANHIVRRVGDGAIKIDGNPDDWAGIPPTITDPVGDYLMADVSKGGNVRSIYLCTDRTNLYLRLDFVRNLSKRITYTLNFRGMSVRDSNDWYTVTLKPPLYCKPGGTAWAYNGKVLEMALPLKRINFDREGFIQIHTKWMKLTVDNTGWQQFQFSP